MQSGRDSPSSASTDTSITSLIATAQGPSTYTRAPKGKACLNCRKRKLKCDCAHPVCRQCARYNRGRDCEYTSKDQRSRTEILEETIANLRARIAELEHPDETQNHFNQYRQWQIGHDDRRTSSPAESHSTDSLNHEPSYPEAQALINAFLPHSAEVGFFLNPSRFLNWVYSQTSPTIRTPSSFSKQPAMILEEGNPLIWAAWVWGAAFTDDINLKSNGEIYLSKALDIVSAALRSLANGTLNPSSIVHIIQSEVLLANYFFYGSRFAEGRQHISAAVSLVLSYGLHKTGSQPVHDPSMMRSAPGSETEMALPPPIDTAEEGERICAFWQVYILDKTWANVLGKPSLINEIGSVQTFIDAPWPLPTEQYVEGPIPQDYGVEGRTLSRFLSEAPNFQTGPRLPLLALRAQAAALLDKASVLSSSSASDSTIHALNQTDIERMELLINRFILFLGSLQKSPSQRSDEQRRHLAITLSVARLAAMQLYFSWFEDDIKSATHVVSSSKAILDLIRELPPVTLRHVDPLLPIILTTVAQVSCNERLRLQDPSLYKRQILVCPHPYWLEQTVEDIAALLTVMNPGSKLSSLQLDAIQSFRTAIGTAPLALGGDI